MPQTVDVTFDVRQGSAVSHLLPEQQSKVKPRGC